jgi:hypothetical protein
MRENDEIGELARIFADRRDLVFRHHPDGRVPFMRWQALRPVVETVELPDGRAVTVERLGLLA